MPTAPCMPNSCLGLARQISSNDIQLFEGWQRIRTSQYNHDCELAEEQNWAEGEVQENRGIYQIIEPMQE